MLLLEATGMTIKNIMVREKKGRYERVYIMLDSQHIKPKNKQINL